MVEAMIVSSLCLDLGKAATHALMEFWGDGDSHCFTDELTAFTVIVYNVSFGIGGLSTKNKRQFSLIIKLLTLSA